MRVVDRAEPPQRLGDLKRPETPTSTPGLRQVPNARHGVVSDRSGAFQTVPTSEVPKR